VSLNNREFKDSGIQEEPTVSAERLAINTPYRYRIGKGFW
jgi:hypothetical protein